MYRTRHSEEGFHTKGYIFRQEEMYRIIIGSSNMTMSALTKNKEWNTKLVSTDQGEFAKEVLKEYKNLWNSENTLEYEDFIDEYKEEYNRNKIIEKQKLVAKEDKIASLEKYTLQPNSMQVGFITELQKIYSQGKDKALLISATGEDIIMMTA